MMKLKNCTSYLFCVFILSGCSTNLVSQKRAIVIPNSNQKEEFTIALPSEVRLARTVIGFDGKRYHCDQTMPDTARADAYGASGKASFNVADSTVIKQQSAAEGGVNSNTSILQLNGRSSSVLLGRDVMSQMCLSSANGTYAEQAPMFIELLKVVDKIADKEIKTAETNQLVAQSFLRPEILKNNQIELSDAANWILTKQYYECMKKAEGDESKKEEKCLGEYKQKQQEAHKN
ncbi:hypothetical protein [Acinetobacter sp. AHP123]|uniref:hypothetical protein n=1 Tax=Acinetobacter sp. AHP123 TaxID=2913495 RepID=UPI002074DB6B|nr:hypothetical protein [Acinetobacter sp. AHP123]